MVDDAPSYHEKSNTRRVAYVHDTTTYGGVEIFLLRLLKYLDQNRYTPIVLVPGYTDPLRSSPPRFIQQVKDLDVPLIKLPIRPKIPGVSFINQIRRTNRVFKENSIDVVHIHTCRPTGARIPTISAWFSSIPAIIRTEHMSPSSFVTHLTPLAVLPLDRMTDYILTVSDANLEEQVRLIHRDRKRLYRSYGGIELDHFHREHNIREAKTRLGLDPNIPVIGSVGRLSPEKGHTYLLRAVPLILKGYGSVKFLIIGDGPLEEQLKQEVTDLGLDPFIQFTGFLAETKPYMEAMDIGVMPSVSEAFGLALVEFMALGIPTVTTGLPCFREVIVDGETGLIASLGNEVNLADHILKLLHDPEMAMRIGNAALERVPSQFSIQRLARDMMNLYDRVIDSKSQKHTVLA